MEYSHLPQCLLFNRLSTRRHSIHLKMDAEQERSYKYFCETYLAPKVLVVALCAKVEPLMFVHSVPGHLVATAAHLVIKTWCSNKFVEFQRLMPNSQGACAHLTGDAPVVESSSIRRENLKIFANGWCSSIEKK